MPPYTENSSDYGEEAALRELDLLWQIGGESTPPPTHRERFLHIMDVLHETFGKRYGSLTLLAPLRREVILEVVYGDSRDIPRLDQGIIGQILAEAKPLVLSRVTQEPLKLPLKSPQEKGLSLLCLPVMNRARPVGVLSTDPVYPETVSVERDLKLLKVISCLAFKDVPFPDDNQMVPEQSTGDTPLDRLLEDKLKRMIEKVDPRTEAHCALLPDIVRLVERIVIKWSLKRHNNLQTATASFLGINRNTLRKKMRDLNIQSRKP
ncbi:MAG: GAF domain-containing protein [Deltaproteobacteria bacterium]|nr:GAF domain-containing protein [Deltaproteobacteria bacterium]MBW2120640.1 GAF domain-containing protein [Deltaproteobacteria bacterium]